MAWGFEGQESGEEAPFEEAEPQADESEGQGRRSRRRRRRGRRDDRGDQRGRAEPARLAANGNGEESQPELAQEANERGEEEGQAFGGSDIPGVGEQPAGAFGEEEREERRGRRRRRGRRGGRRGRDKDAQFQAEGEDAHAGNGSDTSPVHAVAEPYDADEVRAPEHSTRPERVERPAEPGGPAQYSETGNGERGWSGGGEGHRSDAAVSGAAGEAEFAPEAMGEPARSEEPDEEHDPSRPPRRGWWQRRFPGA
jgi:ribonuclease E